MIKLWTKEMKSLITLAAVLVLIFINLVVLGDFDWNVLLNFLYGYLLSSAITWVVLKYVYK